MVYEVFARKSRGEPIRHIGALSAPDDELAKVYAYQTYDEERWFGAADSGAGPAGLAPFTRSKTIQIAL